MNLRRGRAEPRTAMSRRAVLFGAGALAALPLAGCAAEAPGSAAGRTAEPTPPRATTSPRSAAEQPAEPSPEPSTEAPAQPDVEAVIAQHEGRAPQHWGLDIPGVVRTGADAGSAHPDRVFLTLDACGGPHGSGVDERLIAGLQAAGVPATLFLNLRWIEAHAELARTLAADPLFELANHGTAHLPLSVTGQAAYGIAGTANAREAAMEVWRNHVALTELTGRAPRWFRPGTAHLDDVALSIVQALGERVLGFTVNGDGGATFAPAVVAAEVGATGHGGVVIAHMNQPHSGTADGILAAVPVLRGRGLEFALL